MNAFCNVTTSPRRIRLWVSCLLAACAISAAAQEKEPAWRVWKSTTGTTIEAKLISSGKTDVVLEKRDGKRVTVKLAQLSEEDRKFLAGPAEAPPPPAGPKGETTVAGLEAVPGTASGEIACQANSSWSWYAYLPKEFHTGRKWPVCYIMNPSGGSAKTLDRYIAAAEHLGIILAVSKQSKNGSGQSAEAIAAMVKDVSARLPVLPGMAIASGMSGGSRMAYQISETESDIAGILACGSGDGVYPTAEASSFRRAKIRPNIVLCGLFGTNDYNRREGARTHKDNKKDSRMIWFPGNHDWAPSEVVLEGMTHVFGEILARNKKPEWDALRTDFAARQLEWAKAAREKTPWSASRWAAYLVKFPGGARTQSDAKTLAAALAGNADVVRAFKAEKEIDEFVIKYFSDGDFKVDQTPDEARSKAANKLAATMQGLPHAEIAKSFGPPCVSP